ncbi:MAG: DUF5060 domain-containing protein [Chloroflexi bacterium]|nr:DUF5060 domain-containing protein [Chloroflexota bacterium]
MKRSLLFAMLALLGALTLHLVVAGAQEITPESVFFGEHEVFAPLTLPIDIDPARYSNPFDPADIELRAIFNAPGGDQRVIPGFWMQPHEDVCPPPCTAEDLRPVGPPMWQVRFAPDAVGTWTYALQVLDDGQVVQAESGQIDVIPSGRPGFIDVSPNQRYFQYDNGRSYFPIGHNLKWSWEGAGGLHAYREWLQALAAAGGNYARLYIDVPWFIGLEWQGEAGDYRESQAEAARMDAILEAAAEHGIALQVVLLWHQAAGTYTDPPLVIPDNLLSPAANIDWSDHAYSVLNGGPLSGPGAFFYSERVRELFQRRLRYIVARWGYSPQIFAWEIVDEIDSTANYAPELMDSWVQSMAEYLREIDQDRHLITSGSRAFSPSAAANPLLDFTQARFYQQLPLEAAVDQVAGVLDPLRRSAQVNPSPSLLTGFSLNPWYAPTAADPDGIHLQTTLWAAALSGSAGSGMSEWGDTYIVPQGLQRHYTALAAFSAGIDWANLNLQPAEAGLYTTNANLYDALRFDGFNRRLFEPSAERATQLIAQDGVRPGVEQVSAYLYGTLYNSQRRQPQRYRVTAPRDTYFEVGISTVSERAMARLFVQVDGQRSAEMIVRPGGGDVALRVPLLAGEHDILLDNTGDDWLEIDYVEVEHLVMPVRVLTLRDSEAGVAAAWLLHRDYTWGNVNAGIVPTPLTFRYRLDRMPSGRYTVEIWQPLTGEVIGEALHRVGADGVLRVELPPLADQLALRIMRMAEVPALPAATSEPVSPTATAQPVIIPVAPPPATMSPTPTPPPTRTSTLTLEPLGLPLRTNTPRPTRPAIAN